MVQKYAAHSPYALNPDDVVVRNIVAGLVRNVHSHGYAFCPCRSIEDDVKAAVRNICPCRSHRADIARHGSCECGLFVDASHRRASGRSVNK
jgi:ferredoxin-thioredoxin reductase catalytic subunit